MTYSKNAPFRADVVGSYLRPDELKQARADYAAGIIDAAGLKAVEDRLITDLVAKQKAAGLHVITDGEFRRGWWHFDFMWGFNGVDHVAAAHRVAFHDEVTPADTATVTGKLDGHDHPFVEHFKFVRQFEDDNTVARQTMPSPAQTRFVLTGNKNAYPYDEFYKDDDELTADIVAAYRQVIADLYAAGCRNVQFDDCTWTRLCDKSVRERLGWSDEDAARLQQENLDVINAVIADQPDDLVINISAVVISIPRGCRPAVMLRSQPSCSAKRTWTPTIWSSTTTVPVTSRHWLRFPAINRLCLASSPPRDRNLKIRK
jgi:5-methyltetrahydropteroyltriglutamate--homocysteine methyltransferase